MTKTREVPRSMWLLTALIGVGAAALWLVVCRMPAHPEPFHIPVVVITGAFLATWFLVAELETGKHTQYVDLSVVPMLVGLCFMAPQDLLVARVASLVIAQCFIRKPLVKRVYNVVDGTLVLAVAAAVFITVRGGADLAGPRTWLACYLASLAAYLVSVADVTIALSLLSRRFVSDPSFLPGVAMNMANTGLAVITIDVLLVDWRGVWLLVGALVTLWAIYRQFLQFRQRHANLQLIHRFTQSVSAATDTADVVSHSLALAQEMLRCEAAELVLSTPAGVDIHRLVDGAVVSEAVRAPTSLERALVDSPASRLVRKGQRDALKVLLDERGWTDLVAAPVAVAGERNGVLVVANRVVEKSTFDDSDLKLLEALGSQTAIALRASELVERLRAEAEDKAYQATHDALTGLANRALLTEHLEHHLLDADRDNLVALFFIDLDGFKEVNDALGHHTGDRLLKEIARRMVRQLGRRASIARLGGDEFALVIPRLGSPEEARAAGGNIRDLIEKPIVIDRLSLEVQASVGVALAPLHGTKPEALFQQADIAMYAAKGARTGVELYDAGQDTSSMRRLSLVTDLRHAIETERLELNYQPQAHGAGRHIIGAEALARWQHPEFGWVRPDEFIPIAEQTGLIQPLTVWALRTALANLAEWRKSYPELHISVNVSARSLMDTSLAADVEGLLRQFDVPADALTLEITESSVMADPQRSLQQLLRLHQMGVRLAIDDFGTGYSSLSYLKRLPVDEVKIDKSFVMGMAKDADDAVIVRSTIDLAANLGLEVVAEGVEDERTWELLLRLGCDFIQGYHLSKPLSADDLTAFLAASETVAADSGRPRQDAAVVELRRVLAADRPLTAVAGS